MHPVPNTIPFVTIPFINLKAQYAHIQPAIEAAIQRVLTHGAYIMGPEVFALEEQLAAFCGAKHVLSCSNGTDALVLALRAQQVGPGQAVFVPSFTFAATAEAVALVGAVPVFVDCLPTTYNMDPTSLEVAIRTAQRAGLKPVGVIPVDLFGQPADYDAIKAVGDPHHLWIIADSAQSFGATYKNRNVGTLAALTTTSFFPAKPLGCYGDGGAVFTDDEGLANLVKSLRCHGQGQDRYENVHIGLNARLDTLQAAILIEKLKIFPEEIQKRQQIAALYTSCLQDVVQVPYVMPEVTSVWAQYTVCLPEGIDRAKVIAHMEEAGIPTMVYYPRPLHRQKAYAAYPTAGRLAVCEKLATCVLSLPMSGYINRQDIQYITDTFIHVLKKGEA